ncbi:MAG: hypothetical protein AAF399_08270 [Bacteroidota bacterium]
MKRHIFSILIAFSLLALWTVVGCEEPMEDDRRAYVKPLDPFSQRSELSRALEIVGQNKAGDLPVRTPSGNLQVISFQPSASVTSDNILFIPLVFESLQPVVGAYLQVGEADNHWEMSITTGDNAHTLQVGIPNNVLEGNFDLDIQLFDQGGNVSERQNLQVSVTSLVSECQFDRFPRVEGTDGITVRSYYLEGDAPVEVWVEYYMYTVPDRIDVRYGNRWIGSSGTILQEGEAPIFKRCSEVSPGDGFTGGGNIIRFTFDPAISRKLDVYVSGCLDGGTRWYFDVSCPQGQSPAPIEEWYDRLPDCPCTYEEITDGERTESPAGYWSDCEDASQAFHYGATHEVRWIPDAEDGAGQQCTYDADGRLITSGIAAGSPDLYSPGSCGFIDWVDEGAANSPLCFASAHCVADVRPWLYGNNSTVPCIVYLRGWPANRDLCWSNNPVNDITHMLNLVGTMSCEEVTWLFEAVDDPNNQANPQLVQYIHGLSGGGNPSPETLIQWLSTVSQNLACEPDDGGDHCRAVQRAIINLK